MKSELDRSGPVNAREGDTLPPLRVRDLEGDDTTIDFTESGRKSVLLHFKTTCNFCDGQLSFWKDLVNEVDPNRYDVYGVTSEGDNDKIKRYVNSNSIAEWRIGLIEPGDARFIRFLSTPMTEIVSNHGVIERSWIGAWRE